MKNILKLLFLIFTFLSSILDKDLVIALTLPPSDRLISIGDDKLVAHYSFNGDANDKSGNGNNGIINGATLIEDRLNNPNSAYYFDGLDDHIVIPDSDLLSPADQKISIAIWAKVYSPYDRFLMYKGSNEYNREYAVGLRNDSLFSFQLNHNGDWLERSYVLSNKKIEEDVWTHIICTWDGENQKLFINGRLKDSTYSSITMGNYDSDLYIGTYGGRISEYAINAVIDDIKIFSTALSNNEVLQLYGNYLSAEFSADTTTGLAPLTVQFKNQSTTSDSLNEIKSWQWDFNDDGIIDSEEQNPEWTYTESGFYTVKLTVSDSSNQAVEIKESYITIYSDDPVAHYPFNGNADDVSGFENDGIVYGVTLVEDRFGNQNSAYYFDGIDDYIGLPTDFDYPNRTVCFWFNATNVPEWNYAYEPNSSLQIIYTSDHPNIENGLTKIWVTKIDGKEKICFHNGGADEILDNTFSINENEWFFAAVTVNPEFINYYLNGELVKTINYPGNIHSTTDNNYYNAAIGVGRLLNHRYFNGSIDDIKIFSKALSDSEVESLYHKNLTVDFSADTTSGPAPFTVQFTNQSTTSDSLNEINFWQWDFDNDGVIDSEEENPTWTYTEGGFYSVKLIVSDSSSQAIELKKEFITVLSEHPLIKKISDMPNDQGGWVKVEFLKSVFDTDNLGLPTTNSVELYTVEISDGTDWIAAATTVAYGKDKYSILVPTIKDSTKYEHGLLEFRVIAGMEEGNYVSQVVSGYSVDNLAPSTSSNLTGGLFFDESVKLNWQPIIDSDLESYSVYKSLDGSSFELQGFIGDTTYYDNDILPGNIFYYVKAVDRSGNESAPSNIINFLITDVANGSSLPDKFSLEQNYPNPFNPSTLIKYEVPEPSNVKIEIFNMLGQRMAIIVNDHKTAGFYESTWNAQNLPSGVYFIYLSAESLSSNKNIIQVKKSLLLK